MSWEIHASAADVTGNGYSGGSGISTGNAKDDSPAPKAELLSDPQDIIMDNSLYVPVKTTIKSDDFELHVKVLLRVDSPEGLTLSTPLINGEKTKEMKQVRWNPPGA